MRRSAGRSMLLAEEGLFVLDYIKVPYKHFFASNRLGVAWTLVTTTPYTFFCGGSPQGLHQNLMIVPCKTLAVPLVGLEK